MAKKKSDDRAAAVKGREKGEKGKKKKKHIKVESKTTTQGTRNSPRIAAQSAEGEVPHTPPPEYPLWVWLAVMAVAAAIISARVVYTIDDPVWSAAADAGGHGSE
jgi:hypothetical protein